MVYIVFKLDLYRIQSQVWAMLDTIPLKTHVLMQNGAAIAAPYVRVCIWRVIAPFCPFIPPQRL